MTVAEDMRREFHRVDAIVPPGYRVELVAGQIIVNPPPLRTHDYVYMRLNFQLSRYAAVEVGISNHIGIETPHGDYIPDLTVVDDPELVIGEFSWGPPPPGTLMVAEITSSNAERDRVPKRRAYAAVGIPLYLLVDRENHETVLFSDPDMEAQDYRADIRVPFGTDLPLPAPFSLTLTDFTPPVP